MPNHEYRALCLDKARVDFGKGELELLKLREEKEILLKSRIDPLTFKEGNLKKALSYLNCDYSLLLSKDGNVEALVELKTSPQSKVLLYPYPSRVKALQILKRQEAQEMEENVVFSKTLSVENVDLRGEYYVYEGEIVLNTGGNVVGVKVVTESGVRIVLVGEGISIPASGLRATHAAESKKVGRARSPSSKRRKKPRGRKTSRNKKR